MIELFDDLTVNRLANLTPRIASHANVTLMVSLRLMMR